MVQFKVPGQNAGDYRGSHVVLLFSMYLDIFKYIYSVYLEIQTTWRNICSIEPDKNRT